MYNYLLSLLLENEDVIYSWGFNNPIPIYDGILFSVAIRGEKNFIKIVFDDSTGIYNIAVLTKNMKTLMEFSDVLDWGIVGITNKLLNNADSLKHKVYTNFKDYR